MGVSKILKIQFFLLIYLFYACGVPIPSDRTVVYSRKDAGDYKFKPVKLESYKGDSLFIKDYIIINYRTVSFIEGHMYDSINENCVIYVLNNILNDVGIRTKIQENKKNKFDHNYVFKDAKDFYYGIDENVYSIPTIDNEQEIDDYFLISVLSFKKSHSANSFNGPGEVKVSYDLLFIIYVYNNKNELIYKNERSIRAKPEFIWQYEEALAFPIEKRVTEAHFEEMILEALREYINQ